MREPLKVLGYVFLLFGILSLPFSIFYELVALAFIDLGLTLWGALLLYVRSEEYVKNDLLTHTTLSTLGEVEEILAELKCQGKGIYLPPKYFRDSKTSRVFISSKEGTNLPTREEIQQEKHKVLLGDLCAAIVTPPGLSLAELFERKLGKSFTEIGLKDLAQKIPKLLVEDLEIAGDLEIRITGETIQVRVTDSIFRNVYREKDKLPVTFNKLSDPLCSAVACAFTKSTGRPLAIEGFQVTSNGRFAEANFRLLEKMEED